MEHAKLSDSITLQRSNNLKKIRCFVMAGPCPGHPRLSFCMLLRRGCPGHLARRRASRFCPGMTNFTFQARFCGRAAAHKERFIVMFQADLPSPVPFAKIFRFTRRANHLYKFAPAHPTRGAYRDRHGRGVRMRWTRQRLARDGIAGRVERLLSDSRRADERRFSRTAKSCGPDAPTLASSFAELRRPYRA